MKGEIFIARKTICPYCGESFDRDKVPFIKVKNRYAHQECYDKAQAARTQEEKDKEALEQYILQLFNVQHISPKIRQQIGIYIKDNNYTYNGILKTLMYHYEIKKGDVGKANGGIGIVPYVYQDAYNYFYEQWKANQKNQEKIESNGGYQQKVEVVKILPPIRKPKKIRKFMFLEREEEDSSNEK